jgi:hypothetical protein
MRSVTLLPSLNVMRTGANLLCVGATFALMTAQRSYLAATNVAKMPKDWAP